MNKICTSLEQSKKLIELGIDINTADMYYQYYKSYSLSEGITEGHCDIPVIGSWKEHHISIPDPAMPNADFPAWSLAALLELIPPYLGEFNEGIDFGLSKAMNGKWYSAYYQQINDIGEMTIIKVVTGNTSVDTLFEMVVWLKENNKI